MNVRSASATVRGVVSRRRGGRAVDGLARALLLVTLACVFVPLSPRLPPDAVVAATSDAGALDWSWAVALNQAMVQGLHFGPDINFTFGPYASVYTLAYGPATDTLVLIASALLAAAYAVAIGHAGIAKTRSRVLLVVLVLAAFIGSRDALLQSYPIVLCMASIARSTAPPSTQPFGNTTDAMLVALFIPLGLLPLVKGTMLVLSAATVLASAAFFLSGKKRDLAIAALVVPLISAIGWWLAARQPLLDLPSYFLNMLPIASGYTEAMAAADTGRFPTALQLAIYGIVAALLLVAPRSVGSMEPASKIFLSFVLGIYLFVSFKGGFVRHDAHATVAGDALLLAAVLTVLVSRTRATTVALVLAVVLWFYIDHRYLHRRPGHVATSLVQTYRAAWTGTTARFEGSGWPQREFDAKLDAMRRSTPLPLLDGTSDVYANGQLALIASGNRWSPRPVFQSYAAYTPSLLASNRSHLLGDDAPRNVFFKLEPLDRRFPSLDDGASWPVLLSQYRPAGTTQGFLLLRHRDDAPGAPTPTMRAKRTASFGERVDLPADDPRVVATIDIALSLLGRIVALLYKPSPIEITVELVDGTTKTFTVVSAMAASGFLVSPLVETTDEFARLYDADGALDRKRVKGLRIDAVGWNAGLWNRRYAITFGTFRDANGESR